MNAWGEPWMQSEMNSFSTMLQVSKKTTQHASEFMIESETISPCAQSTTVDKEWGTWIVGKEAGDHSRKIAMFTCCISSSKVCMICHSPSARIGRLNGERLTCSSLLTPSLQWEIAHSNLNGVGRFWEDDVFRFSLKHAVSPGVISIFIIAIPSSRLADEK